MALCEQCGSISIVLAKSERLDKVFSLFGSSRPFICCRCGWRARRDWSDEDLRDLSNYGVGGAEYDPALAVLDTPPPARSKQSKKRKPKAARIQRRKQDSREFDLGKLDLGATSVYEADRFESAAVASRSIEKPRPRALRRRNSRQREVVATIAATALVVFLVVMLGLTGSCAGGGADAL